MSLMKPVDALAATPQLDGVARRLTAVMSDVPRSVRDFLHGTWLGHPLHPALVYVPIGAWLGTAVLDLLAVTADDETKPGTEAAAATLLAVGLAAAPVAAAAGAADWTALHEDQQRIGVVHVAANSVALAFLGSSWLLRRNGHHGLGRLVGLAGTGAAGVSASIGTHLAFRFAAGANHAEHVAHVTPGGWHYIGRLEELPEGQLWKRSVGDTPVVVLRRGSTVRILAATCAHLSGPLNEGRLVRRSGQDCVVCPWHGSTFRFRDGAVITGPATAPQPLFEVMIEGGAVNARVVTAPGVPAS